MTRIDPSLVLTRLVVLAGDKHAYDEVFHEGLNLIRGENSTGKSTIANMIFYALGGDYTKWTPEAARCDQVVAEVLLNGTPLALRREMTTSGQRPTDVFWGDADNALGQPESAHSQGRRGEDNLRRLRHRLIEGWLPRRDRVGRSTGHRRPPPTHTTPQELGSRAAGMTGGGRG